MQSRVNRTVLTISNSSVSSIARILATRNDNVIIGYTKTVSEMLARRASAVTVNEATEQLTTYGSF
jgi:ethanolamine utilization microcompartment shell protein EutS